MAFSERLGELYLELGVKGSDAAEQNVNRFTGQMAASRAAARTASMQIQESMNLRQRFLGLQAKASAPAGGQPIGSLPHQAEATQNKNNRTMDRLGGSLGELKDKIDRLGIGGIGGAIGAFGGAATIRGLGSAGSPVAAATLNQSFQLLAAVIGRDFVPIMFRASLAVQQFAFWWLSLDPKLKETGANVVIFGTAVLGGVFALSQIAGAIRLVTGFFFPFGGAVNTTTASLAGLTAAANVASARLMLLGAAGAGAGAAGAAGAAGTAGAAGAGAAAARGGVAVAARSPIVPLAIAAGTAIALPYFWELGEKMGERIGRWMYPGSAGVPGRAGYMTDMGGRALRPGERTAGTVAPPAPAAGATRPDAPIMGYDFQSQFHGIEDMWKSIQQQAAGSSPLDALIDQIQRESLSAYLASHGSLPVTVAVPAPGALGR